MAGKNGGGTAEAMAQEELKAGDYAFEVGTTDAGQIVLTIGVHGVVTAKHFFHPKTLIALMQACAAALQAVERQKRVVVPPRGFKV